MKIGIYGGSFNPPHLGHMAAAKAAKAVLGLDRLLIVPACDPPHKELTADSATPAQRLDMARIMADQIGAECWDVEIARAGVSYTVDTLEQAKKLWPEDELWLLMGTDMFLTLQYWREPRRIMELAGICAFGRSEKDSEELFATQREYLSKTFGARIATVSIPDLVDISSTALRKGLAEGRGREYLHEAIYGYILRERIYGTFVDLSRLTIEELRCVSYSMVKAKRLPHIRGTERTAVELARRFGADPEEMRRAAILHDCTKYMSRAEHLAICDRYGVELDDLERSSEKLLHSKSGAALAKYVFGQNDRIYTAIMYHTTGRGNMTLEEKILYLADYIEPCRNFPEVGEMRRLAETDLDAAVLMGVRLSIAEMLERNRIVHHNTLEAEASLMEGQES
ncbi:MAG: bis(5'-nucleosyl)-tetraphosphatase (symmetrical) YqeK [Oscillospiraceae bacterium]|nr:bis(5'-nucleosyl)-tetraphosphatase (symmetrical) YqeK [Oscillospiraceae bacterium]